MYKLVYKTDNYVFVFDDAPEAYYLDFIKNGEKPHTMITIEVKNKSKVRVASYWKEFDSIVNNVTINNFINKFMYDADYRKEFLRCGVNVDEVMKETIVNEKCSQAISRINKTN